MPQALIPAFVLSLVAFVGMLGLRSFAYTVRIAFDGACFAAITLAFYLQHILPMFPPLRGEADVTALLLRVAGGAWWLLGARLVVAGLWFLVAHDRRSREARLFFDLSAAAIYVAAATVVLGSVFALPVTGLVATSGAIAILVGLALQSTLADVFAGIAVGIEAPFRIGDTIKVGEKAEGEVVEINWRSIRILTGEDNIAILPNSLVAKADIVNRSFPTARRCVSVGIGHPAGVAPDQVVRKLREALMLVPEALPVPAPQVLLAELGAETNLYDVRFSIQGPRGASVARDRFLRGARRQLAALAYAQEPTWPEVARRSEATGRILRGLELLDPLDDGEIAALVEAVERRRLEPGDILFSEGDDDRSLHIVASGVFEVHRQIAAGRQVLGSVGAGDYLGEIGLLSGAAHSATATALTEALVLRLPQAALAPLLKANPMLSAALEQSARRGLDLLQRPVAARAAMAGGRTPFLVRMRDFFQTSAAQGDAGHR